MTNDARRRLQEMLETRIALLREVEGLTRRRTEAVAAGRTDAVSRLVSERAPLIERLVASASEVESLAKEAAGSRDETLLGLVEEAGGLVDRIEALDRKDEAAIAEVGTQARREFERVSAAGRAGRAYQGQSPTKGKAVGSKAAGTNMERSA